MPSHETRLPSRQKGHVFWFFGLSGAGKSTLAGAAIENLRSQGIAVLALDGDTLRAGLCHGLGFSDADRTENLRRAAEAAKLGTDSNLCVVASFITPLESHRKIVTTVLGSENLSFIHVSAPLDTCRTRDTKGLYARAKTGQVAHMTGLSSAFEAPHRADLTILTAQEEVAVSAAKVMQFIRSHMTAKVSSA